MENEENTESENFAQTEQGTLVQQQQGSTVLVGKFKDTAALEKAYGSLQAEFTRRSQRLKELEEKAETLQEENTKKEEQLKKLEEKDLPFSDFEQLPEEQLYQQATANSSVRERIVGEYIDSLRERKQPPVIVGGTGVCAPTSKIKSFQEAGNMALAMFRKRE